MRVKRVVVVGGGASGLVAAICAARTNAQVTLLEHGERLGKKILSTGNGKCNLTNLHMDPDCFRGAERSFIQKVLARFGVKDTLDFFGELGIYPKIKNGYVYPHSEQAASVLDALRLEVKHQGITVKTQCHVDKIIRSDENGDFHLETSTGKLKADAVILAAGSKAAPSTGSDGSGYELARSLGHRIIKPLPALVQLRSDKNPVWKQLAGVRIDAAVAVMSDGLCLSRDRGELQLTDYGISGIPVFQVSRFASQALERRKNVSASIDFLPDLDEKQLLRHLMERRDFRPDKVGEDYLTGLFPKKLALVLLKQAGIILSLPVKALDKGRLLTLAREIKEFYVPITAANPFANAQICCGGVDTALINPGTMESLVCEGLYLAGEILDADGICGGYNLQWAWSTGAIAGEQAGRRPL